jgi:hypothetical protein
VVQSGNAADLARGDAIGHGPAVRELLCQPAAWTRRPAGLLSAAGIGCPP